MDLILVCFIEVFFLKNIEIGNFILYHLFLIRLPSKLVRFNFFICNQSKINEKLFLIFLFLLSVYNLIFVTHIFSFNY